MFFLVSCMPILGHTGKSQLPTGSRMDVSFFAEVPWSWLVLLAGIKGGQCAGVPDGGLWRGTAFVASQRDFMVTLPATPIFS